MSEVAVYAVVVVVAFVVSFMASRRVAAGDRRYAGVAAAPLLVLVVWPILTLTGDITSEGWLALPGLAVEAIILVVAVWQVAKVTIAGFASKSAAEFETRATGAMADGILGFYGLVLVGAVIALIGLLVIGVSRAIGA